MFGFLGQLGSAIGRGGKLAGGMFAKGFKKLGELQDGGAMPPKSGPGGTGGFDGNDGLPQVGGLINRRNPMQEPPPALRASAAIDSDAFWRRNPMQEPPPMEPLRDSVTIADRLPSSAVSVPEQTPQLIPMRSRDGIAPAMSGQLASPAGRPQDIAMPAVRPQMERAPTLQETPIPQLPGRRGEPIPFNEVDYGEYRHVMDKMGYDPEGRETGVKRSWKDMAINALLGANQGFQATGDLGGALGGALAGGAGTAITPQGGREFQFQEAIRPRIEDRMKRRRQGEDEDWIRQERQGALTDREQRRRESDKRIENYDIDNMARRQELQMRREQFEYEKNRPPAPRARNTYRDADGFMRDRDTNDLMRDPQTGKPIKGYDSPRGDQMPYQYTEQGIFNRGTGSFKEKFPASAKMSREATEALREVNQNKTDAAALMRQAGSEKVPAKKAELEQKARESLQYYNDQAAGLAELFPGEIEAGEGDGGYWYVKPKGGAPTIRRGGGNAAGGSAKLSDLKKLLQ